MTAKYYVTLTDYGATRVAQAHESTSILLSQLVIGDANNIPYDPIDKKSQTALVNQRATVPVQSVQINGAVTTVTATIAANIGGFNIHEIGLKDDAGKLVYIGNYHGGYKPVIAEGAGGELTIVIDITAESGKDALIEIDPNVVTANKKWVIDNFVRISTFEEALNNEKDARIYSDNLLNEKIDQANLARLNGDKDLSDRIYLLENAPISPSLGVNQNWQDVTHLRALDTNYFNNSGGPRAISVVTQGRDAEVNITVNGLQVWNSQNTYDNWDIIMGGMTIIPNGQSYKVEANRTRGGTLIKWMEMGI